ncbi:MAG: error-prone DNA polymerase [Rhodocyclaceae bacterium]|nr:error-prone DNA polymerase [Rhodocyclaceae bacterium]
MKTAPLPGYAELHCLSNFSFLRGASSAEELMERAAHLGYAALAITDECTLAGAVRAHLAWRALPDAARAACKLIIGTEIQLANGPRLVLLATNRNGYGNLCELITSARMEAEKGSYRVTADDFACGLPDCLALYAPRAGSDAATIAAQARWVAERFLGRAWLAVELHHGADDAAHLAACRAAATSAGLPLCAAGDVHMHVRARRRLQDVLTAIGANTRLEDCGMALWPNGERHLRSRARLAALYPAALLAQTLVIVARCNFTLDELRYEYPEEIVPAGHTPDSWLAELAQRGYTARCEQIRRLVAEPAAKAREFRAQIKHELALIAELHYAAYFLTVHDIVAWARARGILCQGRGSAANSAVCYALGITEVDPWRASMLFERFISRERNEPPDIDVDFEHERREEVIQYLYSKYGRTRAALAAAVTTYRPRSALRDVGRALGFDVDQLNELNNRYAWWDGRRVAPERLTEAGFDLSSPRVAMLIELTNLLVGFPRHLSQHTGGFVIARGLLSRLVPVENARMAERSVIQWDKDDLDALGLLKIDVLALGMLTAIRKTLDAVNAAAGSALTLGDIPPEDPATYAMLRAADSVGVFQVESRAQMAMLPRLQPRRYYDLVVEVAIVRPGPIQGGMVHPYLRRRQGLEPVDYPSAAVQAVLERTLGVPIFQEQVMQLAVVAAGFTPGEADQLRRSMAAWRRRGSLHPFQAKLVEGMRARGYSEEFAERIFRQIEGFGEYGFPESHAASFAHLVYASAWLKRHHPAAFLCGLLNSQPMGFYMPAQLIADARRHGVDVLPADAVHSDWDNKLEAAGAGFAARLGLRQIKGLAETTARRMSAARAHTAYADVDDLARRAQLSNAELRLLAAGGALASLAGHRRQAYWAAAADLPDGVLEPAGVAEGQLALPAPSEGQTIGADYASLGYTLGRHPLALLRARLARERFVSAQEMNHYPDRKLARTAGIVTCRQRPGTASGVVFVTLEDETGYANIIVRGDLVEKQRRELLGASLLGVYGQISREGPVVHLIAQRLVDRSELLGSLETRSRNFH